MASRGIDELEEERREAQTETLRQRLRVAEEEYVLLQELGNGARNESEECERYCEEARRLREEVAQLRGQRSRVTREENVLLQEARNEAQKEREETRRCREEARRLREEAV